MVLYLGLPGWAGTRRNHQLTPVRKKKEDLHRQQGPLHGSSSPLRCFEPVRVVRPIQYAGSSSHSTYCYAELAVSSASSGRNHRHYLRANYWRMSTSFTNARHLLHCMVQRTITEADAPTIHLNATRSELSVPPPPSSPIFMPNALSAAPPPVIEWCWLAYPVAWLSVLRICGRNFNLIWIDVPITFSGMQSHKLVEEIVCQWVYISWL